MKRFSFATIGLILFLTLTGFLSLPSNVWTNGQDAAYVIGQPDFTSNTGYTTALGLYAPSFIAIDYAHSKLYTTDAGRVKRYAYPIVANQPTPEIVFGQPDFNSWAPGLSQNALANPYGIAVDSTGRLWVADFGNNRVVWFNSAYSITTNQPNADGVLGQSDFTHGNCNLTINGFCHPEALAISTNGTLFVADVDNNRVMRFDNAASKANGAYADGLLVKHILI